MQFLVKWAFSSIRLYVKLWRSSYIRAIYISTFERAKFRLQKNSIRQWHIRYACASCLSRKELIEQFQVEQSHAYAIDFQSLMDRNYGTNDVKGNTMRWFSRKITQAHLKVVCHPIFPECTVLYMLWQTLLTIVLACCYIEIFI